MKNFGRPIFVLLAVLLMSAVLVLIGRENVVKSGSLQEDTPIAPTVLNSDDIYLPIVVQHTAGASCEVIQNVIDSLPDSGGQILISSGTFTCDTAIVIARDNVDMRGQGPSTILRLADGAQSPVIVIGDISPAPAVRYSNIRLSDLAIDGNRTNQLEECWGGPCGAGSLNDIRNNGVTLRAVSDVLVERVSVTGARSGGLVTEKGCERITVSEFAASDNYYDGIAAYETENSVFRNLFLHDNDSAGLSLDIGFNHNIISDAVLTNNGSQGIFMRDSRNNLFATIQIRNSGEQGLFLAQVDADPTKPAYGNTFHGLVVSDSAKDAMRVNDASCEANIVIGAQFINNGNECLSEPFPGLVEQYGTICR